MDLIPLMGIPWVYAGHTQEGADCWGFVRLYYRIKYKVELPDYADLYKLHDRKTKITDYTSKILEFKTISPNHRVLDDIIVLNGGMRTLHVGVYLENDKMIHSDEEGGGSHIASLGINSKWGSRIVNYWRPLWK